MRLTEYAGHETDLGAAAAADGWPVVIAVGGDGTVHGVANGVLQNGVRGTVLGHVPIGTGNDFAQTVGLHKASHPERNLERILSGTVQLIDVGRVLDEYFINSCGVGFGPEVVRRTSDFARLRGFTLYVASAVRAFFAFNPVNLRVIAHEHRQAGRLLMVEAAIGKTAGGGFKLTPDASPDDGLLDVCVIGDIAKVRFLRYLLSALRGTLSRLDAVRVFQTTQVTIETDTTPLRVHLDGELRTTAEPVMTVQLVPGILPVLCAQSESGC